MDYVSYKTDRKLSLLLDSLVSWVFFVYYPSIRVRNNKLEEVLHRH